MRPVFECGLGKKVERCIFLESKAHLNFSSGKKFVKCTSYIRSNTVYMRVFVYKLDHFYYSVSGSVERCMTNSINVNYIAGQERVNSVLYQCAL
jgi:hypothetical protein